MHQQQLIKELQHKLTKNIGEVVQLLLQIFDPAQNVEASKEARLQMSRINRLKRERRIGKLTYEQASIELANLTDAIDELLLEITEEEAETYYFKTAIQTKILILCKDQNEVEKMETLFAGRYYKEVQVKHITKLLPIKELKSYELLIYNNYPSDDFMGSGIDNLLRDYLEYIKEHQKPLLYFGKTNSKLNDHYREYIYFANSKFSIHARIQEMLLYLQHEESREALKLED